MRVDLIQTGHVWLMLDSRFYGPPTRSSIVSVVVSTRMLHPVGGFDDVVRYLKHGDSGPQHGVSWDTAGVLLGPGTVSVWG